MAFIRVVRYVIFWVENWSMYFLIYNEEEMWNELTHILTHVCVS